MKFIPYILILTGGIMIYAGAKGDNPVEVFKSVLTTGTTGAPAVSDAEKAAYAATEAAGTTGATRNGVVTF